MARQQYLDYLRAFCTLCVIGIHTSGPFFRSSPAWSLTGVAGGVIDTTVRVGLPLFFMISGALLLAKPSASPGQFYLRRFPKILVPFLLYSAIYYTYTHTVEKPSSMALDDFFLSVAQGPQYYHLWFVYALIGIYLVTPFLSLAISHTSDRTLWTALLVMLTALQIRQLAPMVDLQLDPQLFLVSPWLLYFVGGYAMARLYEEHWRWAAFLGLAVLGIVSTFFARAYRLQFGIFDQGLNMYALSFGVFGLFISARRFLAERSILGRTIQVVAKYSYEIYLVHPLVLLWLRDKVFGMTSAHPIWNTFALTAAVLVVSLLVAAAIQTIATGPCLRLVNRLIPRGGTRQ